MFTLLILNLIFALNTSEKPDDVRVIISVGQKYIISSNSPIYIGSARILRAEQQGISYSLIGIREGSTFVEANQKMHHIEVLDDSDFLYYQNLKAIVKNFRGLNVDWQSGCSLLTGELLHIKDYIEIFQQMRNLKNKSCNNDYIFQAKIRDKNSLETFVKNQLHNIQLFTNSLQINREISIHLPKEAKEKYKSKLSGLGLKIIGQEHIKKQNIETEILVAEIRKKDFLKLGLQWPSSYSMTPKKLSTEQSDLLWTFHGVEEKGLGRVLASPKIISLDGSEASFLAGGEIPLRISTYKYSHISWKTYGIQLKVNARRLIDNRLQFKTLIEVSMPDYSQKVEGLPGFFTNRMESEFQIQEGESLILSGLIREDIGRNTEGLPLLQQIPIIGSLFSSKDYHNNKTELVILIRPQLMKN